jgi:ATP-dependent Lon protease
MAQALGKPFFLLALGGETKTSTLVGTTPDSSRYKIGQIANFLIEGEKSDPLILLDEIDKTSTSLHNILNHLLDSEQNQNIQDHCLGAGLDFSKITFVITANDKSKIPKELRDRMKKIVELTELTREQKKQIASNFLQK